MNAHNRHDIQTVLKCLAEYISHVDSSNKIPDIMFRRSLNETWFSDTLAWLLDPKSKHGLGVKFLDNFVEIIAKKRSEPQAEYRRRDAYLKFGKAGKGRAINGFSLKNAAVCREFYLSKQVFKGKKTVGTQYCDIVVLDLDSDDGIFITIENKLLSSNHPNQLENYYKTIEHKYNKIPIREYIYLTIREDIPQEYAESNTKILSYDWIRVSWVNDILPILEKLKPSESREVEDLGRITSLLTWLKKIVDVDHYIKACLEEFVEILIESASSCLLEELNRLTEVGTWSQKDNIKTSIIHSAYPAKVLRIHMLPRLYLTAHGEKKSKQDYEKVLIPFGASPDQVLHLIDLSARDICNSHFNNPQFYLAGKRRLTVKKTEAKLQIEPLLKFMHKYKYQLQVLISLSERIKVAEKEEMEENFEEELS